MKSDRLLNIVLGVFVYKKLLHSGVIQVLSKCKTLYNNNNAILHSPIHRHKIHSMNNIALYTLPRLQTHASVDAAGQFEPQYLFQGHFDSATPNELQIGSLS